MMWIVASVPFWMLGGLLFLLGVVGTICPFVMPGRVTNEQTAAFIVGFFCLLGSATIMLLAAKVAS